MYAGPSWFYLRLISQAGSTHAHLVKASGYMQRYSIEHELYVICVTDSLCIGEICVHALDVQNIWYQLIVAFVSTTCRYVFTLPRPVSVHQANQRHTLETLYLLVVSEPYPPANSIGPHLYISAEAVMHLSRIYRCMSSNRTEPNRSFLKTQSASISKSDFIANWNCKYVLVSASLLTL